MLLKLIASGATQNIQKQNRKRPPWPNIQGMGDVKLQGGAWRPLSWQGGGLGCQREAVSYYVNEKSTVAKWKVQGLTWGIESYESVRGMEPTRPEKLGPEAQERQPTRGLWGDESGVGNILVLWGFTPAHEEQNSGTQASHAAAEVVREVKLLNAHWRGFFFILQWEIKNKDVSVRQHHHVIIFTQSFALQLCAHSFLRASPADVVFFYNKNSRRKSSSKPMWNVQLTWWKKRFWQEQMPFWRREPEVSVWCYARPRISRRSHHHTLFLRVLAFSFEIWLCSSAQYSGMMRSPRRLRGESTGNIWGVNRPRRDARINPWHQPRPSGRCQGTRCLAASWSLLMSRQ